MARKMALTRAELIAAGVEIPGSNSAESFIPTGSTVPTNGIYLPNTNTVAVATNGVGRLFVDSNGFVQVPGSIGNFYNYSYYGPVESVSITSGGSGYTDGVYDDAVFYTDDTLWGFRGSVTVSGGVITDIVVQRGGRAETHYVGAALTLYSDLGPGIGFSATVASVRTARVGYYSQDNRIRLSLADTTTSANQEIGSILFSTSDANNSYYAAGDSARIYGRCVGTLGGGKIDVWTAGNGEQARSSHEFGSGGALSYMYLKTDADSNAAATLFIEGIQNNRNGGGIYFGRENALDWSASTANCDGFISFAPVRDNVNQEAVRIESSGRVGIGTSDPGQLVQIGEGNTGAGTNVHSVARIEGRAVAGGQQVATLEFNQLTPAPAEFVGASIGIESGVGGRSESELVFKVSQASNTSATEAMRLSDGRLGIGTTPDSPLQVIGTGGTGLRIGYTNNTNYFDANTQIFRSNAATTTYGQWDSSGRLLVGTSSGSGNSLLQVQEQRLNGGDGYSQVKTKLLTNPAKSADHTLFTLSSTGTTGGSLGINKSSAAFTLSINLMLNATNGGNAHVCYTVRGVITKNFTGNISLTLGTAEQITSRVGASEPGFTVKLTSATKTSANLAVNFTTPDAIDDCKLAAKIETIGSNTTHGPMLIG